MSADTKVTPTSAQPLADCSAPQPPLNTNTHVATTGGGEAYGVSTLTTAPSQANPQSPISKADIQEEASKAQKGCFIDFVEGLTSAIGVLSGLIEQAIESCVRALDSFLEIVGLKEKQQEESVPAPIQSPILPATPSVSTTSVAERELPTNQDAAPTPAPKPVAPTPSPAPAQATTVATPAQVDVVATPPQQKTAPIAVSVVPVQPAPAVRVHTVAEALAYLKSVMPTTDPVPTEDQDVLFILSNLRDNSAIELGFKVIEMNQKGDNTKKMHPIRFVFSGLLQAPDALSYLVDLSDSRLPWKNGYKKRRFLEGWSDNMSKRVKDSTEQQIRDCFDAGFKALEMVGQPFQKGKEHVYELCKNQKWQDLLEYLASPSNEEH